ncbi:glycosyl hydrolase family 61-domain-containing protein [Stachybotrys elegans]|uniref:lytic cellulose monooxygenase (C4-dehydrogenating) n=1 Tax=Stachybotrys elegans TaxID=80388 RepID=A0A8K0SYE0_9HYPO|nr:glycosyl hydrolase family 61-domain-containing protein [Stachybotrys elegans]
MKTLASALLLASAANAHTLFTTLFINGENQGDGTCVRQPDDGATATGPIYPITGDDMACGRNGENAVPFICPAPSGSKLTFEFREWPDFQNPGSIDPGHQGPCSVYMKKVNDMFSDSASGSGWFKIWEDGYDQENNRWCVDTLVENDGLLSVTLPSGLPTGYYLVRPEVIALHAAYRGDAQFYTSCAQIYIGDGASGSLDIPSEYEVSIPGYVSEDTAGVVYNLYENPLPPYPMPGPEVFRPSGGGDLNGGGERQAEGVIPDNCILKNANWCAEPIPKYSGQSACWNAVEACYAQSEACWESAPPSGSANCYTWSDYCEQLNNACEGGDWEGPPEFEGEEQFASSHNTLPEPWAAFEDVEAPGRAEPPVPQPSTTSTPSPTTKTSQAAAPTSPVQSPGEASEQAPEDEAQDLAENPVEPGPEAPSLAVSEDGQCGGETGQTCEGSRFGDCCSRKGRCGRKTRHCTCGCQSAFGLCSESEDA